MSGTSSSYGGEAEDGFITEINVTPLVDVVLVLLIVMMITMPAIISQDLLNERQIEIDLPDASAAVPLTSQPQELVVNVDKSGRYTVLGEAKSIVELFDLLARAERDNPGRAAVLIRADKQTYWQAVASVIDQCNRANLRRYRVSVLK